MTKTKKGLDCSKVTSALVNQVKDVIADADKHTYSVSKVYAAHNAIYGLREQPQTCSSCLRNRARDLRSWLKGYDEDIKETASKAEISFDVDEGTRKEIKALAGEETAQIDEVDTYYSSSQNDQAEPGVIFIPMREGQSINLIPKSEEEKTKGIVRYADGTRVSPGKYYTANGQLIIVRVGGKARIELEDLT